MNSLCSKKSSYGPLSNLEKPGFQRKLLKKEEILDGIFEDTWEDLKYEGKPRLKKIFSRYVLLMPDTQ